MFAELCAKSNFSFLEGVSHPEELVASARELGLSAIGVTDRDGIYGLVRAYREVKERGGKLVSGAELTLEYDGAAPRGAPRSVFLLVRDHDGYRSLCRLLTLAHHGYQKGTARLRLSTLAQTSRGLELIIASDEPLLAAFSPPASWGPGWRCVLEVFAGRVHVATHRWLDGLDARRTEVAEPGRVGGDAGRAELGGEPRVLRVVERPGRSADEQEVAAKAVAAWW